MSDMLSGHATGAKSLAGASLTSSQEDVDSLFQRASIQPPPKSDEGAIREATIPCPSAGATASPPGPGRWLPPNGRHRSASDSSIVKDRNRSVSEGNVQIKEGSRALSKVQSLPLSGSSCTGGLPPQPPPLHPHPPAAWAGFGHIGVGGSGASVSGGSSASGSGSSTPVLSTLREEDPEVLPRVASIMRMSIPEASAMMPGGAGRPDARGRRSSNGAADSFTFPVLSAQVCLSKAAHLTSLYCTNPPSHTRPSPHAPTSSHLI